jgi:putative ABC transport system substrate-binding protein
MRRAGGLTLTLGLAVLSVAPVAATAQPARIYRIGVLANLPPPPAPVSVEFRDAARQGLEDGGFVEGRNLAIEFRWEPDTGALSRHAAELAQSGVDAILAFTTPATRAAANASRTTPIVFSMVSDPIGSGFVASLARPGGHITGITNVFPDLSGKLLELLREAVPGVKRTAVLWNPDNPGKVLDYKELESAAQRSGVRVEPYHVRARAEFAPVFAAIVRDRPDALIVLSETLM